MYNSKLVADGVGTTSCGARLGALAHCHLSDKSFLRRTAETLHANGQRALFFYPFKAEYNGPGRKSSARSRLDFDRRNLLG